MQKGNLLASKKFLPLFISQFLGAFNDTLFRTTLIILITYKIIDISEEDRVLYTTIAGGLFILPFVIFSGLAGQISDKFNKAKVLQIIKFFEIIIVSLAVYGFITFNVVFLIAVLFLMGSQSAFFGPAKYSILPDHLENKDLILGNGLVEAGTFIAVLLGTVFSGLLINLEVSYLFISFILLIFAILGFISSLFIPNVKAANSSIILNINIAKSTFKIIKYSYIVKPVFLSILGISWFWVLGAVILFQMPMFVKNILGAGESVLTFLFTTFSIGVAIGSLLCNRLLKGQISPKLVPFSILLLTFFLYDVIRAGSNFIATDAILDLSSFLLTFNGVRLTLDFIAFSILGGIYIVPLYAIMQNLSSSRKRSQIVASNNIINSLFMVIATVISGIIVNYYGIVVLFKILVLANLAVGLYMCKILPSYILKSILQVLLGLFFRVKVKGLENYHKTAKNTVIIANHTSLLDGILLAVYMPDVVCFAVNTHIAQKPFFKFFLNLVKYFPIDPLNSMSTKLLIDEVKKGNKLVIFPEGRLTITGSLMKVYEGSAMIVDKANADILPIRIDGAAFSLFSRLHKKYNIKWFPKITLTILPPRKINIDKDLFGRGRRKFASDELYDIMADMMVQASDTNKTLFTSLMQAKKISGGGYKVLEDINRKPISYNSLITKSLALSGTISKNTIEGSFVGILMPNAAATVVLFFAMQSINRVPAMLNFSAGISSVTSAIKTANIKVIYTSKKFIENANLHDLINAIKKSAVKVVYLEDVAKEVTILDKMYAILGRFGLSLKYSYSKISPSNPAVVLFTSGSEGSPKGVVLSHLNIQTNCQQIINVIDLNPTDKFFSSLPMFHSFGLTASMILPVLAGISVFFYPSPLHYRIIPEMIYDTESTVIFGTDTFFAGYAKFAHSYDFKNVRYAIVGAEKLKEETKNLWMNRFGIRIFEGYGATEASPVLSVNTPMHNRLGSVGKLLPGISYKLEPVDGIEEGSILHICGGNVMLGYLLANNPGVIDYLTDSWYNTGDIVFIDEHGYIFIKGRAKRFAKIGGEMVSLSACENFITEIYSSFQNAVVSVDDKKKGEQLVLITTNFNAKQEEILNYANLKGISNLNVPKIIIFIDEMPLLGSGKYDYPKIKEIAFHNLNNNDKTS
jgi:acyl-[acyl-carrier-protein]-phospholipid O-acyltransferase/long-chain-fatty-acid--[acyl-carrier-protein] ligase